MAAAGSGDAGAGAGAGTSTTTAAGAAFALKDSVAWVTGSSRGIGRVIAHRLAALGARVVIHGTREDSPSTFEEGTTMEQVAKDIASATGAEVIRVVGDLSREDSVKAMVGTIERELGPIDVLVACAGGNIGAAGTGVGLAGRPEGDDAVNISESDVRSLLDRNLMTTVLCCAAVAPGMMERKRGRVVTIGSVAGCCGRVGGALYAVAKAAVHEYTRCLAEQLRPYNVPVNSIAPGATLTERFVRHLPKGALDEGKASATREARDSTLVRYGDPIETANAVAMLCTAEAQFISGQVIRVDGGDQLFPA